ncbi:MAG: DUF3887 domain-containing protein [Lachnospiraceae bacterium]|nr:DUF3887 domain-containing protein [Lachnospiraceae bacterium]
MEEEIKVNTEEKEIQGENIPDNTGAQDDDKKKKSKTIGFCLLIGIPILVLFAIVISLQFIIPKSVSLDKSEIFDETAVKESVIEVIDMLDENDLEGLKEISIPEMGVAFEGDTIPQAKSSISDDFGERISIDSFTGAELKQNGTSYAVTQTVATYENTKATYTITLDSDMKLAGLFMK